jgi:hypothetical protein
VHVGRGGKNKRKEKICVYEDISTRNTDTWRVAF